jgi:uncharacterized protein YjbI with pentapeptide repeats
MMDEIPINDLEPEPEEFDRELDLVTTRQHFEELLAEQDLYKCQICNIDLGGIDLEGIDLTGTQWTNVNLRGANLSESMLDHSKFRYVCLDEANLSGASLIEADFNVDVYGRRNFLRKANLTGSFLQKANLREVFFLQADLSEAQLLEADLSRAVLNGCTCRGTDFSKAQMILCEGIGACFDESYFSRTNLSCMNFSNASLIETSFHECILEGVNWTDARRTVSS